jgi:hypothetical protein
VHHAPQVALQVPQVFQQLFWQVFRQVLTQLLQVFTHDPSQLLVYAGSFWPATVPRTSSIVWTANDSTRRSFSSSVSFFIVPPGLGNVSVHTPAYATASKRGAKPLAARHANGGSPGEPPFAVVTRR